MHERYLNKKIKSDINIIPFLDILLILLIICITIPSTITQNFEINLINKTVQKNSINDNNFIITIEIIESRSYNIITESVEIKKICFNQLELAINSVINHSDSKYLTCFVAASKATKYHEIIQVLNLLNKVGIYSIGMITTPV